jgi:hypothetical protein
MLSIGSILTNFGQLDHSIIFKLRLKKIKVKFGQKVHASKLRLFIGVYMLVLDNYCKI